MTNETYERCLFELYKQELGRTPVPISILGEPIYERAIKEADSQMEQFLEHITRRRKKLDDKCNGR